MPSKQASVRSQVLPPFDVRAYLESAGVSRRIVRFARGAVVFAQGAPANSVFYIQDGAVKLSVLSPAGKEAVVAMLGAGDFFGEGCLAGQPLRMGTATADRAERPCCASRSDEMVRLLHERARRSRTGSSRTCCRATSASKRTWSISCSTRARSGWRGRCCCWRATARRTRPSARCPKLSQETLAEMVGTTRSRVNFFMNKFRKLGFIEYNGGLKINSSLLSVVLHD